MLRRGAFWLTAVLAGLPGANVYGDTISNWTGGPCTAPGVCGNWSTAKDWTPPAVPNNSAGTGYDVTIGSSGFVKLDISPAINSLALDGTLYASPSGPPPQLTVVKGMTIKGGLVFASFSQPDAGPGSLSAGGDLSIGSSSPIVVVGNGSLAVGGNFSNATPRVVQFYSASGADVFHVGGTFTNGQNSVMLLGGGRCFNLFGCNDRYPGYQPGPPVDGPSTSTGTFVNNGKVFSWSDIKTPALVNYGSTSLIAGSTDAGSLKNGGTISLLNACCSIGLEPTAGLNVGSGTPSRLGYNQFADGILDELLLGSSTYGTIDVAGSADARSGFPGTASLNGTLDIMLKNGFVPTIGESFTILSSTPGGLSGAFNKVTWDAFDGGRGEFKVFYENAAGNVVIKAEEEAVPEPSTLLPLAPALGFLFWLGHRRGVL